MRSGLAGGNFTSSAQHVENRVVAENLVRSETEPLQHCCNERINVLSRAQIRLRNSKVWQRVLAQEKQLIIRAVVVTSSLELPQIIVFQ